MECLHKQLLTAHDISVTIDTISIQGAYKMMTNRERLIAILERRSPDRIPWIPRLEIWHQAHIARNSLPKQYQGLSLREIESDLNIGTPARQGSVYRVEYHNVDISREINGMETITTYKTPVGSVNTTHRYSETLALGGVASPLLVSHMIKDVDDYDVVEYIFSHATVHPTYEAYAAYDIEIGSDGLPMTAIGPDPMYRILQVLIGFNNAFYHLYDDRAKVMHLYDVINEFTEKIQQVALDSPAVLIQHGEHFDAKMTPPNIYSEYMLPYFQTFFEKLHAAGKYVTCHADADTSNLLELIIESGFDMAECFVTAPMVPLTLSEARKVLGEKVIIWGGIPSVILCDPITNESFESFMMNLLRTIAPGDAFILGVADNVMAEAKLERIQYISQLVEEYCQYPISL